MYIYVLFLKCSMNKFFNVVKGYNVFLFKQFHPNPTLEKAQYACINLVLFVNKYVMHWFEQNNENLSKIGKPYKIRKK